MSETARGVKHWLGKGAWTIVDQSFFAFSNFVLNIVLARWLTESDYGAFSLAFSIFLLLGVIFNALMVEPMMVYGSGKYKSAFSTYIQLLTRTHWKFVSIILSVIGLIIACCFYQSSSFTVLLTLACFSGFMFYQWLLRRACYLIMQPHIAAIGGLFYFVVMMAGVFILKYTDFLNAITGMLIMAVASLVASCWIKYSLKKINKGSSELDQNNVYQNHWEYGRWAIGTNVMSWIPGNIYFLVLGWWYTERTPGDLKAVFNFALPMLQLVGAFGPMIIPIMVQASARGGFDSVIVRLGKIVVLATVLYATVLGFFGSTFLQLLYQGKYIEHAGNLWLVGFLPIFAGLVMIYGSAIRAMEKPKLVFQSYIWVCAICVLIGLPITYHYGVAGAVIGMLVATMANALILYLLYCKHKPVITDVR